MKVNRENILDVIEERVIPIFKTYQQTRRLRHLTKDDLKVLEKVWTIVNPTSYFNAGCGSCIKFILDTIQSFYEREFNRVLRLNKTQEANQPKVTPVPDERPVKQPKKGKKRKPMSEATKEKIRQSKLKRRKLNG